MADRTITVRLLGDAANLGKAFKDAGGEAKELEGKLSGLGGHLTNIATTAAGFFSANVLGAAPGFFMDAARAAAEDQAATDRLNTTMRQTADRLGDMSFDQYVKASNDAIAAGQKLGYTDDEVRDSLNYLFNATDSGEDALKRHKAAMDLARGAGIDLQTATKMLGKMTDENVNTFKKLGIELPKTATEADALAAVQARFGGQADAYAKSTAGQFEQLKIRLSEAKETIGYALLPVMAAVGEVLATKVVPMIEAFAAGFQEKVVPAIEEAGSFIQENVLPPLQRLGDWFTGNQDAMIAAAGAIGTVLVVAFTAWAVSAGAAAIATLAAAAPVIAIGLAIAALAAGIVLLIRHWDDITAKYPAIGAAVDAVKEKLQAFGGWVTDTFVPAVLGIYNGVKDAVDKAVGWVRDNWDTISAIISPAVAALEVVIKGAWNQIQTDIQTVWGVLKGIFDTISALLRGDFSGAWDGLKETVSAVWTGIQQSAQNALTILQGLAGQFLTAATGIGSAIADGLLEGLKMIPGVLGNLADAVWEALKYLINSAIDAINNLIPDSLGFDILGKHVGIDLPANPIPRLARGGVVVAGDNPSGIEAIVPLERAHELGFGGGGTVFNINAPVFGVDDLVRTIDLALKRAGQAGLVASR